MANQATATAEQSTEQSRTDARSGSRPSELARGRQIPRTLALSPIDFLALNPFSLMDRIFGEVVRTGSVDQGWMPAIEASERDGKYVVRAELPGLKPEEVKLVVKDNMLVLDGERKLEREEDRGGIHRTEIRYGKFHRVVPIPEGADVEQAKARFDNGVLEVTVPLPAQESRRREIPIEANSQQPAEAQKQG